MAETSYPPPRNPRLSSMPDEIFSLRDLMEILSRRRAIILAVVVLVTLPATVYSVLNPPLYTATASIMIEPRTAAPQRSPIGSVIDTQRDIINSPSLIEATMEDLNLYEVADFQFEPDKDRSVTERLRNWIFAATESEYPVDVMDDIFEELSTEQGAAPTPEEMAQELAERKFAERLWVRRSGESLVLNINFSASRPTLAAKIANHIADLYLQRQLTEKRKEAEQTETWMTARIAGMREQVLEAERRLADFRSQHKFGLDQAVIRSDRAVRYQELERQAEAKRATYATMLSRYYENWHIAESIIPDARLISLANVPTKPSSPSGLLIAVVSLVASAILGCAIALVREQTDGRIFSARQAEKTLGLRCFGSMSAAGRTPQTDKQRNRKRLASARVLPDQAVSALCVRLTTTSPAVRTILVTSVSPREDRDMLAPEIAVGLGRMASERILLVDFGMSGSQAASPKSRGELPGAMNAMAAGSAYPPSPGRADTAVTACTGEKHRNLKSLIVRDSLAGIDVLPAGSRLGTERMPPKAMMSSLLHELDSSYDFIVVDAPELLSAPEAQVVAPLVDTTILVVHSRHTTRDQAEAGLQLLGDIGAGVLGIVLSHPDGQRKTQKKKPASRTFPIEAESLRTGCKEQKRRP